MPLSDWQIKYLLEKATPFWTAQGNDLPILEQALDSFNQIIDHSAPHPRYFFERSEVKYRLSQRLNRFDLLTNAVEDATTAIRLDPDRGSYYRSRGSMLWEILNRKETKNKDQQLKDLKADYQACLSREPTCAMAWLDLIAIDIIYSFWDEAISLYGQCKPYINSRDDQLYRSYLGCLALILAGDPVEDEDKRILFDETVKIGTFYSRELRVGSFLGRIRNKEGIKDKWSEAIEIEKLLIGHIDAPCNQADLFKQLGLYDEALLSYDKAIEIDPKYVLAWESKGWLLRQMKHFEEALQAYDKTLKIMPENPNTWNNKGNVLWDLNRYDEAIQCYEKTIKLDAGFSLAWRNKGELLKRLHRPEEALKYLEQATKLDPNYVDAWNSKGGTLWDLNRYEEGVQCYEKTIELNPGYSIGWRNKGVLLRKLHRPEEALRSLEKALELNPNYTDAWNDKGTVLEDLGKYAEAIQCFDKAIALNPEFALAKNNKVIAQKKL